MVNKVIYGSDTLIDLTSDTVTPETLRYGYTAHNKAGELIIGTCKQIYEEPIAYDYVPGYTDSAGKWLYENSTNNHTDIYEIQEGHRYLLSLGAIVGTRFRAAVIETNPIGYKGTIAGKSIIAVSNPTAYANRTFTAEVNGWLTVTKDNNYTAGLKSYLLDFTIQE